MRNQTRQNSSAAEVRRLRAEVVRLKAELKSVLGSKPKYTRYADLPPPHPDDIRAYREGLEKLIIRVSQAEPEIVPNK